jgi:hypothetical protein
MVKGADDVFLPFSSLKFLPHSIFFPTLHVISLWIFPLYLYSSLSLSLAVYISLFIVPLSFSLSLSLSLSLSFSLSFSSSLGVLLLSQYSSCVHDREIKFLTAGLLYAAVFHLWGYFKAGRFFLYIRKRNIR